MDERRQPPLDRAPGERYAARPDRGAPPGDEPGGSRRRALAAAVLAAAVGAVVFFALGLLDLGVGLLAVAAAVGWAVALALRWGESGSATAWPSRPAVAGVIGALAILAGLAAIWAWARWEGGVLGPLDYFDQRFGIVLTGLDVAVAGAAAAIRAR